MAKTPTPHRAALAAAVQAVRDRADERSQIEAAFELASEDISKILTEMGGLIEAIAHHPKGAAEELLARVGRKAPQHVLAQFEDQAREEEPQSSRDLKAKLRLAEEILEDRKRVRAELQVRLDGFDQFDFTLDRARRAARAVILDEAGEVVAKAVADGEAAMLTLIKTRATLGWLQTHRVWGDGDRDVPLHVRYVLHPMHDAQERTFNAARASSPWGTIIDDLLADPAMQLPGVPK